MEAKFDNKLNPSRRIGVMALEFLKCLDIALISASSFFHGDFALISASSLFLIQNLIF